MSVARLLAIALLLLLQGGGLAIADASTSDEVAIVDSEDSTVWVARYRVFYGEREIGSAERYYRLTASGYKVTSRMQPSAWARIFGRGVVEQSSAGKWSADGKPQPDQYSYLLRKEDEQPQEFQFDYARGVLTGSGRSLSLPLSTQDELSQLLLLRTNLEGAQQFWSVPVVSGSKQRIYEHRFQLIGEHELVWELQSGEILRRVQEVELTTSRNKYRTLFWLAAEIGYLPLKIERQHLRKDELLTLKLESLGGSS